MTAEIGVMRISDQIDALAVMDISPVGYLVTPRLLASLAAFPLLTAIFNVIGIFGGYLSACVLLGLNEGRYFSGIESSVTMSDVSGSFLKAVVFASSSSPYAVTRGITPTGAATARDREAVGQCHDFRCRGQLRADSYERLCAHILPAVRQS